MRRYIIPLALVSSLVQAKIVLGVGEYRYGPDTPQNIACIMAEESAKQNAITRFAGEEVESLTSERCSEKDCELQKDTFNDVKGYIKQVHNKQERKIEMQGYTSCIVTIRADVDRLKNEIKLNLTNDSFQFKMNDEIVFRGVVNKTGNLAIYNLYENNYKKVYEEKITAINKEFMLPSSKNRIVAKLPDDKLQSKEVIMFIFTENDLVFRDNLTELEMKSFITSIPSHQRQIVTRYVYIMRNML